MLGSCIHPSHVTPTLLHQEQRCGYVAGKTGKEEADMPNSILAATSLMILHYTNPIGQVIQVKQHPFKSMEREKNPLPVTDSYFNQPTFPHNGI